MRCTTPWTPAASEACTTTWAVPGGPRRAAGMNAPRWLLVITGTSAGDDALREAVDAIRKRGVHIDVRVTWEPGDGARCVDAALANGVDAIVAAGGDGTLSEVATALA